MLDEIYHTVAPTVGLPWFGAYFGTGLVLFFLFMRLYMWATPQDELKLIRSGNTAAGISLGGALMGFTLPVATMIYLAHNLIDLVAVVFWGLVGGVAQIFAFWICYLVIGNVASYIEEDNKGVAFAMAFMSVSAGLLNAMCMTP